MYQPDQLIGQKIGSYTVRSHIQRGGMADVFLAHDEWLDRSVALKLLFPQFVQDEDFVARFRREARAVAKLRHPNIVQIYTTGVTDENLHYLAMEYVAGGTLHEQLAQLGKDNNLYATPYAINLIRQIADALATAHRVGIVHRDIKPSNILLRRDGAPVLTDLGIAMMADDPRLTRTNALLGTPSYMSPEQATGTSLDGRSDIYSLGVILFELLAGQRPFNAETPWSVLHQHINEPPPPLPQIRPDLSHTTCDIVNTCLQKAPDTRYQTAELLVTALDTALTLEMQRPGDLEETYFAPVTISTSTVVRPLPTPTPSTIPFPTPAPVPTAVAPPVPTPIPTPAPAKRSAWLYLVPVVIVLAVIAAILYFRSNQNVVQPPVTEVSMVAITEVVVPTNTAVAETPTTATEERGLEAVIAAAPTETATATPTETAALAPTETAVSTHTPTLAPSHTPSPTDTPTLTPLPSNTPTPSNPTGGSSSGGGLPLQFESFGVWVRGDQDNGTFLRSTEQAHGGSASGKLSYDFGTSDNDFVVFLQNNSISGNPNTIQAWVYGDGSGHFLNAWISDSGNETWQVPLGQVFHTGWSQMTGYIDTEQEWPWTHISGPNNDKVDYPISFRGLVLDDFNSAYTGQGTIYIDDLTTTTSNIPGSFNTPGAPTATPGGTGGNPTATLAAATAVPNTGTLGRILYTSGNILLTTDPTWSSPQEVGTAAVNSCNSTASTVTGQTINLYFGNICGIGENGTGVCASPNSSYEVVTNALGDGQHSISVRPAGSENFIFVYQGTVDRGEGIRWSPLSDSFLFVVGDTVHRSTLDGSYNQIIPTAFTPIISANGSTILYRKPIGPGINDIFVANIDGSNQTNVTNVASIDKRCAAWVR